MRNIIIFIVLTLSGLSIGCEKNEYSNELSGVTFTRIISASDTGYLLDGNIVNYDEITGYDSTKHIFLLSEKAGERIRKENYPVSPTRFAIALNGEIIYIANFIPGYSSISCDSCITIEPYSYDNKYRIVLGYPDSDFYSGIDPRNDCRIISTLKRDNKLIQIHK